MQVLHETERQQQQVGHKNCPTLTTLSLVFNSQVDCNHFESGTVLNIVFLLCTELLSTPLMQIIIQQKLVYTWQGCKSDPFKTQGKTEIMSYRNLSKKTVN